METAEGASDAGHPSEHSTAAASATTKSDMHPRREYRKEASEESVVGQASAGPAPAEDGHGSTRHGEWTRREEGGDENPRRAISERATADRETEERAPPNGRARLTRAADERGEGTGEPPTQQSAPMARSEGSGGDPREHQQETPPRGGHQDPEGALSKLSERGSPTADRR